MKKNYFFGLLLLFLWPVTASIASSFYPLDSTQKELQFNHLLKELRCLVCQNQDLADSNAQLAKDLRQQVYELVRAGKTELEIKTYLSSRFGDFILFKPQLKTTTVFLYFGPFLFLLLGFFILWHVCRKRVVDE